MIQNLPLETAWHLRGTRRVGVSIEDVELVQECVSLLKPPESVQADTFPGQDGGGFWLRITEQGASCCGRRV